MITAKKEDAALYEKLQKGTLQPSDITSAPSARFPTEEERNQMLDLLRKVEPQQDPTLATIPANIQAEAKLGGAHSKQVKSWFQAYLLSQGVSLTDSPADWPEQVWQVYGALQNAQPGYKESIDASSSPGLAKLFRDCSVR